jgi:hypothetical protein
MERFILHLSAPPNRAPLKRRNQRYLRFRLEDIEKTLLFRSGKTLHAAERVLGKRQSSRSEALSMLSALRLRMK